MTTFQTAIQETIKALRSLQKETDREPRASRDALGRLITALRTPKIETRKLDIEAATEPLPVHNSTAGSAAADPNTPDDASLTTVSTWDDFRKEVLACTRCPHLVSFRTNVVFGVGNTAAELMFVGEAPGADEDAQGEPFVGKAGQLLTKIIEAMAFRREDVYIANVLKCRPSMPAGSSGNRPPLPEEMATCLPYLKQQIDLIKPKVIVALGGTAMNGLFGNERPMREIRGRWHDLGGTPVMATYHPAYLLRNQSITEKRKVWEDMLLVLERLGKPITSKQRGYFLSK